jgi:hypothetical protein
MLRGFRAPRVQRESARRGLQSCELGAGHGALIRARASTRNRLLCGPALQGGAFTYGAVFTYTVLLSAPPGPVVPVRACPPRIRKRGPFVVGANSGLVNPVALYTLALGF